LRYGVPASVDAEIAQGRIVICNVSRAAVAAVRARYARACVVLVTASEETLAARLAMRGREPLDLQRARLQRAGELAGFAAPDLTILNDGPLSEAAAAFHAFVLACSESATA
jgi:ribose 1,5-bisphosphokinase